MGTASGFPQGPMGKKSCCPMLEDSYLHVQVQSAHCFTANSSNEIYFSKQTACLWYRTISIGFLGLCKGNCLSNNNSCVTTVSLVLHRSLWQKTAMAKGYNTLHVTPHYTSLGKLCVCSCCVFIFLTSSVGDSTRIKRHHCEICMLASRLNLSNVLYVLKLIIIHIEDLEVRSGRHA